METLITIEPTPKQVAEAIWNMDSRSQAEMFSELLKAAGSEHNLMMQFLYTREVCKDLEKKGDSSAYDAFLTMFSSAYKWFAV